MFVVFELVTNQLLFEVSNWIGCPGSPGTLSVTLLTTSKKPPFAFLISTPVPASAAFLVFANLIDVVVLLIAKYITLSFSIPSGVYPLSL